MDRSRVTLAVAFCIFTGLSAVTPAQAPDDERRAAIKVLRAINTAENAAAAKNGGAYLPLAELLNHPAMGGVKADFAVTGNSFKYLGAEVRVALSADASQYVVTVKSGAPNHTAAFTDERGVIYTGKALE